MNIPPVSAHAPKAPHCCGTVHWPAASSFRQLCVQSQAGLPDVIFKLHVPPLTQKGTSQAGPDQQADSQTQAPSEHEPCRPQSFIATHFCVALSYSVQPWFWQMHIDFSQKLGPTPQSLATQSDTVLVWHKLS